MERKRLTNPPYSSAGITLSWPLVWCAGTQVGDVGIHSQSRYRYWTGGVFYLHLGVLSLLARDQSSWDPFVLLARSPYYLALDVLLLAGILIHGLNGLRVALTGFDVGVRAQKTLFGILMLAAAVALVTAALKMFGG